MLQIGCPKIRADSRSFCRATIGTLNNARLYAGRMLTLIASGGNTGSVDILDSASISLSTINFLMGPGDALTLISTGAGFFEVARSNN